MKYRESKGEYSGSTGEHEGARREQREAAGNLNRVVQGSVESFPLGKQAKKKEIILNTIRPRICSFVQPSKCKSIIRPIKRKIH